MTKLIKLKRFYAGQCKDFYINPENICDVIPLDSPHSDITCWIKTTNGDEHNICTPLNEVLSHFDVK